jgi:DNA-binding PadR family transcriptional regulator
MGNALIENLSNPTLAKIILEIHERGQLTAKELLEKFPRVSQPTMYRYLKAMLADGTLKVTSEKQVRGTVEKSYSVAADFEKSIKRIVTENDGAGYLSLFASYLIGVMAEFRDYSERENIDILNDGSGFTIAPVYATTAELQEALLKVGEILQGLYRNKQTKERKLHNICLITTPPKATTHDRQR